MEAACDEAVIRDLNALHQAVHDTKSYGQRYLAMRDKSYAFVESLGWNLSGRPRLKPLRPTDGPLRRLLEGLLTIFRAREVNR